MSGPQDSPLARQRRFVAVCKAIGQLDGAECELIAQHIQLRQMVLMSDLDKIRQRLGLPLKDG
jgi:hypothetical protein